MIRHKILDVWVKEDNPASQEVFKCFKNSIEKDYKHIEILSHIYVKKEVPKYIKVRELPKDETKYVRHRLILKYDNGYISAEVINMIVKDFYPNYNKDCNETF